MPVYLTDEGRKQVVVETLESIKAHSSDCELIVVDDGSKVPSAFLKQYADTYVRQPNQGISRAWNVGKWLSKGEYVCVVNDDIKVCDGWLEALSAGFEQNLAAVTAPILAGPTVTPMLLTETRSKFDYKFYPGFCFMLWRERYFEDWDEQFKTNCGDTDYWHRIRLNGLDPLKVPLAIWHKEGDTLKRFSEGYEVLSKHSIELFRNKWDIDPQPEYYSL